MNEVTVRVEVVGAGAPVTAETTDVEPADGGLLRHGVRVTWRGSEPARLDDARFGQHTTGGRDDGHLITAGRGCGASWDDQRREVLIACTADLQIIEVQPGQTHEYPVTLYPRLGPLQLTEGTYVSEQDIGWWPAGDFGNTPQGSFTLRLTYEVR